MIHCLYGKLGAGKGLVTVKIVIDELANGFRDVITNLPLKLDPWVNGNGQPQMGLVAYLENKYGWDCNVRQRLLVVPPEELSRTMFLYRRNKDKMGQVSPNISDPDWWQKAQIYGWTKLADVRHEGKTIAFDTTGLDLFNPCLVVTDEAWKFYPAKNTPDTECVEFYGRQQRKMRDEWWLVTQHHDDLHCVFARISQDHTVVRNHGMERLGIFRQPGVFHTQEYQEVPKRGARVFRETAFRLDRTGMAQTYDTSAGVGMAGGLAADIGTAKKGLHIAWLVLFILLGIIALAMVPYVLSRGTRAVLGRVVNPGNPAEWAGIPKTQASNVVAVANNQSSGLGSNDVYRLIQLAMAQSLTNRPVVTGMVSTEKSVKVYLSDGKVFRVGEDVINRISQDAITVNGQVYYWADGAMATPPGRDERRRAIATPLVQ